MMNPEVNEERWRIAQKYEKEYWESYKKDFDKRKDVAKSYWDFHLKILEGFIHIERETRILEIGTGTTPFINYIIKCEKYALDPLMDYYTSNSEISGGVKCIKAIGETIPFPDDYFDIVITTNTSDHVINPSKVLSEINRVLKKRGVLYFTVKCWNPLIKYHKIVKEFLGMGDKGHPHSFSIKNIRRLLENSGLKAISTRKGKGDLGAYVWKKLFLDNTKKFSNFETALVILKERGLAALIDRVITKVLLSLASKLSKEEQEIMDFIFVAAK